MPGTSFSSESGDEIRSEPTWDVIVFQVCTATPAACRDTQLSYQVEDRIFHAFPHTFASASEVFEGLFLLPQGAPGEGLSKDRPIVLQGCRASDFAALMKVLHPM